MQRLHAILMSVLLVTMTALPTFWRMDCYTSGRTSLAWGSIEACCHDEIPADVPIVESHCCSYQHVGADISEQIASERIQIPLAVFVSLGTLPLERSQPILPTQRARIGERPPPKVDRTIAFRRLLV